MNRKSLLIVKLVCLCVLLVVVGGVLLRCFWGGLGPMRFSWDNKLERTESFSGVQSVEATTNSYSITVTEQPGTETKVEFYSGGFQTAKEPVIQLQNGVLIVKETNATAGISFGSGRIVISVPEGAPLDYSLTSTSGSLKLYAPGKTVSLASTSGSVKVYQGGETLDAVSTSGSVKVYGAFKSVSAASTSGDVKVTADENTTSVSASSTSGSVKIRLPKETGYTLDFMTVSGSVKDEYRGSSFGKSGSTEQGDGQIEINASSVSGSIKLTDWDD